MVPIPRSGSGGGQKCKAHSPGFSVVGASRTYGLLPACAPLAVVACRTSIHHVIPEVFAAQMARLNMIHCQFRGMTATIPASTIIPVKHFPAGQLDPWPGSPDHVFETDDRRPRQGLRDGADDAAPADDQACLACKNQADGPPGAAHVDGLNACIEDEHWLIHGVRHLACP